MSCSKSVLNRKQWNKITFWFFIPFSTLFLLRYLMSEHTIFRIRSKQMFYWIMRRSFRRSTHSQLNIFAAYASYFWSIILNILYKFAEFTSLHGFKNIIEDFKYLDKIHSKLSKGYIQTFVQFLITIYIFFSIFRQIAMAKLITVIVWTSSVIANIYLVVYLFEFSLTRALNTPTVTTIENTNHPVFRIPFPAVTLCNCNIVHRSSVQTLLQKTKMYIL